MERFVIIDNGWKPLTIIAKHSILDVALALDLPLLQDSIMNTWRSLQHLETPACILKHNFIFFSKTDISKTVCIKGKII